MRAGGLKASRPVWGWTAALLLGSGLVPALAAERAVSSSRTPPTTVAPTPPSPALSPGDWAPEHAGGIAPDKKLDAQNIDAGPSATIKPASLPSTKDTIDPSASDPSAGKSIPPQLEPLPALNAALKSTIDKYSAVNLKGAGAAERRKERAAIAFFYAAHGFASIWSASGKPVDAVASVRARLARADEDALDVASPPGDLKVEGSPEDIAESELAMTEAVVSYARQATGSRVDTLAISPLIGNRPNLADPADVLDAIVGAGADAGDKLRALNPTEPRYVALRDKLVDMRGAKMPAAAKPIPAGPTLRIGMHDRRVPLIRARFDVNTQAGAEDTTYDAQTAKVVADFQRTNGFPPTGTLNQRTLAALAGPRRPARLEGVLVANMEMWRWMPRNLGANRIEVNIPDYLVTVFHEGVPLSQNRVVVGKVETPTPLFSNTMKYLIVNPYWNVPQSIIKKEMLPKGGGSLSYLEGRGYSVAWHGDQAVVKQLPGDKNALGRIKFLFPNDYSVYLHDTPSKALFSASKRAFSHGCVRVDQPFAFGDAVLNDVTPEPGRKRWSEERLENMIGAKERYVNLPAPLPIHIEYFTATAEASGKVKLRDDVYGYAGAVAAALGHKGEPERMAEAKPRQIAAHPHRKAGASIVVDDYDPR